MEARQENLKIRLIELGSVDPSKQSSRALGDLLWANFARKESVVSRLEESK